MKKQLLLLLSLSSIAFCTRAQMQNCLDFDGIDDYVSVPGASALIAGSQAISMTCWVYPENGNISFPDYDGFVGFRDDAVADFYLVQFGNNRVEARFRNSSGANFDIVDSSLQLNSWQQYALVYDGDTLFLYRNGNLVGFTPASGAIATTSATFNCGYLSYLGNDFYLQGKLDEVSLWNQAITADEVNCIYNHAIDPTSAGLRLYYRFNQGIADGLNDTITSLIDEAGSINGNLNNFTLTGTLSNFTTGTTNYSSIHQTLCPGEVYIFGSQTLDQPGIYTNDLAISQYCDSVIQLTLEYMDTSVTANTVQLEANQSGASYQWVDCNNGYAPITGETGQVFVPGQNGNYAVVLSYQGCSGDTSACYAFTTVGISFTELPLNLEILPNPATDRIVIRTGRTLRDVRLKITDITGRQIVEQKFSDLRFREMNVSAYPPGVYLLTVESKDGTGYARLLKN